MSTEMKWMLGVAAVCVVGLLIWQPWKAKPKKADLISPPAIVLVMPA